MPTTRLSSSVSIENALTATIEPLLPTGQPGSTQDYIIPSAIRMIMPLGDPHGGNFEYTVEGLPENIFACIIPVSDIGRSVEFYSEVLGMELFGKDDRSAYMVRGACRTVLRMSDAVGIDTGIVFGVDSPYNTRRRLIDEGVEFVVDPVRAPFGTFTSFLDPDGNVISVMEQKAEFRM